MMVEAMRTKYSHPPINELVLGVYFNPPLINLRSEHVGLFWRTVRDEFPKLQQQSPIGDLFIGAPNEHAPMPRYWLVAADDAHLLQIQRNAFLVNWRKRNDSDYPHFETVKKVFDQQYENLVAFLKAEADTGEVTIDVCELTYINLIEAGEYWKEVGGVSAVVPSFRPLEPKLTEAKLQDVNATSIFRFDERSTLSVNIRTGQNPSAKAPRLVLELRASGKPTAGTKSAADAWLAKAHDVIGECFNTITAPDIQQKYWVPKTEK